MHLYILDWSGTLDQLYNPKGFVRALQSLGHKVVIWTGNDRLRDPAAEAADKVIWKNDLMLLWEVVVHCMATWPDVTRIIVSDDDLSYIMDAVTDLATDPIKAYPIEFLEPVRLNAHLTGLAPKTKAP